MYTYILEVQILLMIFAGIISGDSSSDDPVCAVPTLTLSKIGFGQYFDTIEEDTESMPLAEQLQSLLLSAFSTPYDVHDDLFVPAFELPEPEDPDEYEDLFHENVLVTDMTGRLMTYMTADTAGNYIFSIDDADDGGAVMVANDSTHMCCQNANLNPGSYPKAFYIPNDPEHSNSPLELYLSKGQTVMIILQFINAEGGASFSFSLTLPSGEKITNFEDIVGLPEAIDCTNVHTTVTITSEWTETYTTTSTSINTVYSSPATIETTYYVMTPTTLQSSTAASSSEASSILSLSSSEASSILSLSSVPSSSVVSSSTPSTFESSSILSSSVSSISSSIESSSNTSPILSSVESSVGSLSSLDSSVISSSTESSSEIEPTPEPSLDVSSLSFSSVTYSSQSVYSSDTYSSQVPTSDLDSSSFITTGQTIISSAISVGSDFVSTIHSQISSSVITSNTVSKSIAGTEETSDLNIVKPSTTAIIATTVISCSSCNNLQQTSETQIAVGSLSEKIDSCTRSSFSNKDGTTTTNLKTGLKDEETLSYMTSRNDHSRTTTDGRYPSSTADKVTKSLGSNEFGFQSDNILPTQSVGSVAVSPNSSNMLRKTSMSYVLSVVSLFCIFITL